MSFQQNAFQQDAFQVQIEGGAVAAPKMGATGQYADQIPQFLTSALIAASAALLTFVAPGILRPVHAAEVKTPQFQTSQIFGNRHALLFPAAAASTPKAILIVGAERPAETPSQYLAKITPFRPTPPRPVLISNPPVPEHFGSSTFRPFTPLLYPKPPNRIAVLQPGQADFSTSQIFGRASDFPLQSTPGPRPILILPELRDQTAPPSALNKAFFSPAAAPPTRPTLVLAYQAPIDVFSSVLPQFPGNFPAAQSPATHPTPVAPWAVPQFFDSFLIKPAVFMPSVADVGLDIRYDVTTGRLVIILAPNLVMSI